MIKKISLFLLTFILTICLISCDDGIQPVIPTPTATPQLVDNITFRRGETIDGGLLFTGKALQEVYVSRDSVTSEFYLILTFTEEGTTLLEQYSRELISTNEKLSLWIGEDRIFCAGFESVLSNGKIQLAGNLSSEQVYEMYDKFYGIQ